MVKKIIPGTISIPDTKEGWQNLWRCCSSMSLETCEKILDSNNVAHNAMVLLEYRREVSKLCREHGASGW